MRISLEQACHLLLHGDVVALPTETVYGLGASIAFPEAIQKIYAIKGRPSNNPLIIHLHSSASISSFASSLPEGFHALAEAFWPGPLTLVLPIFPETVPSIACAGLPTAAFRIPDHSLTRDLLKICGPLVMPSANLSGKPSATKSEHVELDFGQDFPVLDGGSCQKGLESTILIFRKGAWEIIRQGALAAEHFRSVLGYTPIVNTPTKGSVPLCPGQLYRHYAPKASLLLTKEPTGIVVGFSDRNYPSSSTIFSLGPLKDPALVAENLYSVLRQLDAEGITSAEVDIDFPDYGLWQTISERLHKAARQDVNEM